MLQVAWSCFSTGSIAWRWWLLPHGTTTVRKTSQLFKIGKSKKVLPFQVLVQIYEKNATHTVFGKGTASTIGGCPTPYFKTYFKTFPALMYAFDGLLCFWGSCWTGCHQDNLAGLVGGTANQPILTMRNQEFAMVCFKLSNVGKILENPFLSSGHSSPFFRSKHDFAQ